MTEHTEAEAALSILNAHLASLGQPFKLALVDPRELKPLDVNAHYMTHEVFKNLVENVRKDKALASIPFCWRDPETGAYHTLSGNHRVKAAIAANVERVLVLYDDRPLDKQARVAIQLSHNAIFGRDDPVILRQLWDEIADLDLKYYSGLDDKTLNRMAEASLKAMGEAKLDFKVVNFLFLPEEMERLHEAFQKAAASSAAEECFAGPLGQFERLVDAMDKTKASWNTKNNAVALFLVLDVFERHYADLAEGWEGEEKPKHSEHCPISSVFGGDKIPPKVAQALKKRGEEMLSRGEIDKRDLGTVLDALLGVSAQKKARKNGQVAQVVDPEDDPANRVY